MGIIIGKFRKKKSTYDVLETIDREIKLIEEYRRNTEQSHKRIVGRFILISVGIYLVTAFLFYFYYFPATFYDRLFYMIPLILAPVILLSVKRILTWFYNWKISRKLTKLGTLRNDKKQILDTVMETETYKVAKNILDKFAPELTYTVRKNISSTSIVEATTPSKSLALQASLNVGLRQRATPSQQSLPPYRTPARPVLPQSSTTALRSEFFKKSDTPTTGLGVPTTGKGTLMMVPKNILPRERSVFDKMVDYLVGDGPSNRYALICRNCRSHNGMIFPEEYEYTSFRCCYCYTFNPSRKKRPVAPQLANPSQSSKRRSSSDTSESEKNSQSDTESEVDNVKKTSDTDEDIKADEEKVDKVEENEYKNNEEYHDEEKMECTEQKENTTEIGDVVQEFETKVKDGEEVNNKKD